MDIVYSFTKFKLWMAFSALFGLGIFGLQAQSSGPYEKLLTARNTPISDTVSGMNLNVMAVSPTAKHGDVDITVLQFGGGGNPYVYKIEYTPDNGFIGVDTFTLEFTYTATYPFLVYQAYEVSTFKSIVTPKPDFSITPSGSSVTLDVLSNDLGAGTLNIGALPMSDHGTATFSGNQVTFTPDAGYTGTAHVSYTVCDTTETCKTSQLTVGVHPSSGPVNDTLRFATTKQTPVSMSLLYSGYTVFQAPSNGLLTLHNGQAFTYKPATGFTGNDQFVLSNNNNGLAVYKTVKVKILNTPTQNRMAIDDYVYTPVNKAITFNVRSNDIGNLTVKSWVVPANLPGTVSGTSSSGTVKFTPNSGFSGVATFYYRVGNMFAPNLEMAAIRVTVGNLSPVKSTYDLSTPPETPLVVNYKLPFTTFEFDVLDEPDHGDLTFYPGLTTQQFGNQSVSGYNLLIYNPDAGFTGTDEFEVNYCVTANNQCKSVKINAHVVDVLAENPPYCISNCVWTGDLNNDGLVNNKDLLPLGYAMGIEGETRDIPALEWYGQYGDNWANPFLKGVPDLKYADTDGNGAINHEDTLAIGFFYGQTHALKPNFPATSKGLPFFLDILTPNPGIGDLVMVDVYLGDSLEPVIDLNGFTFDMRLSPDIVDSSFHMTFADNSWLNLNAPYLTLQRRPQTGRLETAFTRTGNNSVTGFGYIGRVDFIITDVIEGGKPEKYPYFTLEVDGPTAQWGNGAITQSKPISLKIPMSYAKTSSRAEEQVLATDNDLLVYPNPAQDWINVHLNGSAVMRSVDLYDAAGRCMYQSGDVVLEKTRVSTNQWPAGLYMLRVQTDTGVLTKKIYIQ